MSRIWKEKLDPNKHVDFMQTSWIGGIKPESVKDNLIDRWVYFVNVCSFTFQFHSIEQIKECLDYFSKSIHPSSMQPNIDLEHYWQRWFECLPKGLTRENKRQKVVKALQEALAIFSVSS